MHVCVHLHLLDSANTLYYGRFINKYIAKDLFLICDNVVHQVKIVNINIIQSYTVKISRQYIPTLTVNNIYCHIAIMHKCMHAAN